MYFAIENNLHKMHIEVYTAKALLVEPLGDVILKIIYSQQAIKKNRIMKQCLF